MKLTQEEPVQAVTLSKSGDAEEREAAKKLLRLHAITTRSLTAKESAHLSYLRAKHGADVEIR